MGEVYVNFHVIVDANGKLLAWIKAAPATQPGPRVVLSPQIRLTSCTRISKSMREYTIARVSRSHYKRPWLSALAVARSRRLNSSRNRFELAKRLLPKLYDLSDGLMRIK